MRKYRYRRQKGKMSKGEQEVVRILEENNIEYQKQKTFSSCVSEKGYPLRFDFYLPEYFTLIEYNGHHHYKPINKYKKAHITHEKTVVNDQIKENFAVTNKFKFIKIPYWEFDNISYYITNIILERKGQNE